MKNVLFWVVPLTLVGCAAKEKRTALTPNTVQTSYDFARPADVGGKPQVAYMLPQIQQGWVPARVDPKTGEWLSGHFRATIVEPGHWATLEEAELSGKKFIVPGQGQASVPNDLRRAGEGEINATIIEQRLAKLERDERTPRRGKTEPSDNSLRNQMGNNPPPLPDIPRNLPKEPKKVPAPQDNPVLTTPPPLKLPGLDTPIREVKPEVKEVKLAPPAPKVPESKPPVNMDMPPIMPPTVSPPKSGASAPAGDMKDEYDSKSGTVYMVPAKSGTKKSMDTDKGAVDAVFGEKTVKVTFKGKTLEVPIKNPEKRIQIKLP